MDKKPVVVTTELQGVFFGYVIDDSKLPERITLERARMCVRWSDELRGVLGLAADGPNENCRISKAVPQFDAWKVTAVMACTPQAAENWELEPWKE